MKNIVEIKNIKKNYFLGKTIVPALKGIDLEIQEGDFISIIGASGSGKRSVPRCVSGQAKIIVNGASPWRTS